MSVAAALQPVMPPAAEALFAGTIRLTVQTPVETHQTKKTAGSSDGAQTYDTPIT